MRLELDWVVGIIRCGDEAHFHGPNPNTRYDFVVSVMRKGNEAYLYGAHGELSRQTYREIVKALKATGIEKVVYERLNTEKLREAIVHL